MKLPMEFIDRMTELMGEQEMHEFMASYQEPRHYGLRVNTLKISVEDFLKISPFELESIPWTRDGFYYHREDNPGRHPYYHAGLYYIQEPSAMLPGEVLDAQCGEKVLDLCAAPGGKTTQIAAGMKGSGLLVSNDISADRVKALIKNIELCGVKNAIVTNMTASALAEKFKDYFDKILVDAPCSGEGMFRKDEDAVKSWGKFKCDTCAEMQRGILHHVDTMLKSGGRLVYSTCTFAPEEDERMISEFLSQHPQYRLVDIQKSSGIESGRPAWSEGNNELLKTARLWPHKLRGEGHFIALLEKDTIDISKSLVESEIKEQDGPAGGTAPLKQSKHKAKNKMNQVIDFISIMKAFEEFVSENLTRTIDGHFHALGSHLYCLPEALPNLEGIKVAKFGWYLGEYKVNRFEPSHSLGISLKKTDVKRSIDFTQEDRALSSYLKGETLMIEGEKGMTAVCVDGYILGWAKQTGDMLKNLYPKGWKRER